MQVKLVKDTPEEKVYAIVFLKGDEVLSGLTDFAIKYQVGDAHFTDIGAVSSATTAWLDLEKKMYHPTLTSQQVEVLSLVGDIAAFNGKPVVHMHAVLGRKDGTTVGGHVWELNANPPSKFSSRPTPCPWPSAPMQTAA
jgi:predicted DNA-binding protein with PD1-like motif